jgi:hypothetical protein
MRCRFIHQISVLLVLSGICRLYGVPPSQLNISQAGEEVTLSWQDTNDWLQSSSTLNPAVWVNVCPTAAVAAGGTNSFAGPADQPAMFYRLIYSPFLPPPAELGLEPFEDVLGDDYFNLWWDAVPGAVSYNLYYAADPSVTKDNYSSLSQGGAIFGITTLNEPVGGLVDGTHYYFVATAVSPSGESADSDEVTGVFGPEGSISGQVFTELDFGTNEVQVPLGGVSVTVSNLADPTLFSQTTTDPDGNFEFIEQPAGSYQLCWYGGGFGAGCCTNVLVVSNCPIVVSIPLTPPSNTVYGQVYLQDGTLPLLTDPFFQIDLCPSIALSDASDNLLQQVVPNDFGQYVMAGAPLGSSLQLSGQLQESGVTTNIDTFVIGEADMVFPKTPPDISNLVAALNGQPVVRVPGGSTVQVCATVGPDAGAYYYQWLQADGTPLPGASGTNVNWTVPDDPDGYEYLFLGVTDGFGGFASSSLVLTVNPYLTFSGQVTSSDANADPIINATVQVNDLETNTDSNGYFSLLVTPANEYDLTITAAGYVPVGKVFYDEDPDDEYVMLEILTNSCTYDGSANIFVADPSGVTVDIPVGALMDTNGDTYTGCVSAAVDLLDPCVDTNNTAGGDYILDGSLFTPSALADIDLEGTNGPLFLNGSAPAQIYVPVSASCSALGGLPPGEQFFTLYPASNRWISMGPATNMTTGGVITGYQGPVTALGEVLMAQAGAAPMMQGVLQLISDGTIPVPFKVQIIKSDQIRNYQEITAMKSTTSPLPIGNTTILVLNPRQVPEDYFGTGSGMAAKPVGDDAKTIIQAITVALPASTAKAPFSISVGLGTQPPAPPANKQTRFAKLTRNTKGDPFAVGEAKSANEKFLARIGGKNVFGGARPGNSDDTKKYYDIIDKTAAKTTFANWQKANGWQIQRGKKNNGEVSFATNPDDLPNQIKNGGDDEFALYFDANDLGAGQRLGIKINTKTTDTKPSVAYYMASYPTLVDAENDVNLSYIFCIDYALVPGSANRIIRFYAFDKNGDITSAPVKVSAGSQPRFVPYVCMVCHGGKANIVPPMGINPDVGGQFIAFDTANYTFSKKGGFTYNSPNARNLATGANQGNQGANPLPNSNIKSPNVFCSLNDGLLTSSALPTATMPAGLRTLILNFINGEGVFAGPPKGWVDPKGNKATQTALYTTAYAISCRACHATQSRVTWADADDFVADMRVQSKAQNVLGGAGTMMPQSQCEFSILWGTATAADLNNQFGRVQNVTSQPVLIAGKNAPPVK